MRVLEGAQGDFDSKAGPRRATWEWNAGGGTAAPNVAGLIASALAEEARACGAVGALKSYAEARLAEHRAGEFLYDGDVEALAGAAAVLSDERLMSTAKEAFHRRYQGATGEEAVARWLWVRHDAALVGFDAAQAIRAALSVGERDKAVEIARAATGRRGRWLEGPGGAPFVTASRGALLEALAMLNDRRFDRAVEDLVHHLVLTQGKDGSWNVRDTQATAYAVRGLSAQKDPAGRPAAERGRAWLRRAQLRSGAWPSFHDGLPEPFTGEVIHEVTAEAMLALSRGGGR